MTDQQWTPETVKAELPKVQVRLMSGKVVTANVSGRSLRFAKVWWNDNTEGWEYSWKTIANALNNNRVLK